MKKSILFFLLSTLIFSCNKEPKSFINNTTNKTIEISSDSIGIIHNEGLDYILPKYTSTSRDIDSVFYYVNILQKEFFQSKGYETEDLSPKLKDLVLQGDAVYWLNNLYKNNEINITLNLKSYLVDILTFISDGNNTPFSKDDFYNYLDSTYSDATGVLSEEELEMLSKHIAVAKSSFEYWFNDDGKPKNAYSRSPINWWEVLAVDCIGGIATGGDPLGFVGASAIDVITQE